MYESEVFFHIFLLSNQFICLRELNTFKEVWKVFVDIDVLVHHRPAEFPQLVIEQSEEDLKDHTHNDHVQNWIAPVGD